jgi:hypothetical protein
MQPRRLSRPSLKISRQQDQEQASNFIFEVWSPFAGRYERVESIEDGLRRVRALASLIFQMWLHEHPKQALLVSVPDVDGSENSLWAEFRVNPAANCSYDTRHGGDPAWARSTGIKHAAATTCAKSGYVSGDWI